MAGRVLMLMGLRRTKSSGRGSHGAPFPSFYYASPRQIKKTTPQPKTSKQRRNLGLPEPEPRFDTMPLHEVKQRFVMRMKDVLMRQPEQVIEIADLGRMRAELDIVREGKSRKVAGLVRRFPAMFELYKDESNRTWCGFTQKAEQLLEEEKRVLAAYEPELVQKLRKFLMMSVDNRIPLDKVLRVRRCLGLPYDFQQSLLNKYPEFFCVNVQESVQYLELTSWDSALAVSTLESKAQVDFKEQVTSLEHRKCVGFPWIFKKGFMPRKKRADEIESFQSASYISPYKNSHDLQLTEQSLEADKFVVAVLHEFLSLTVEKRSTVEQVALFRKEYRLPAKIADFLLRYDGIFYIVQKGTKSLLFLKEGYQGSRLIEKGPLVLWKECFLELASSEGLKPSESKVASSEGLKPF